MLVMKVMRAKIVKFLKSWSKRDVLCPCFKKKAQIVPTPSDTMSQADSQPDIGVNQVDKVLKEDDNAESLPSLPDEPRKLD